jgi:glycosyltransferase involved in cell wall biosynthesis
MLSGVSDYSSELLPVIADHAQVDAVAPRAGRFRRARAPAGIKVVSPGDFAERTGHYDAVYYHLGNNPWHRFVYDLAMAHPGVAVFHEFVMHHLLAAFTIEGPGGFTGYRELLRAQYGDAGERLAVLRARGVATDFEKFLFPLNQRVAARSRVIVVHNEDSRERMHELAPEVPVVVIPHHAGNPPLEVQGIDRAEARRSLGLPEGAFLVGHFGYITRPKQPAAVVGGFAQLAATRPEARLIMIGADRTGGGLDRLIKRYRLDGRIMVTGYVGRLSRFYLYLKAVDAVVNLRYPSAGESSGTFARALAEGRVVIVNNLGSFAEVPPDVALKVEADGNQAGEVGGHLLRLAGSPEHRRGIEARAREYAATMLDPMRCRDLYLSVARLETMKRSAGALTP